MTKRRSERSASPRSSRDHATAIDPVSATANRPSATWSPAAGGCSRRTVASSGASLTTAPAAVALRMKCSRRPLRSPSLGRDGRSQPPGAHELDELGDQRVVPLLARALLEPPERLGLAEAVAIDAVARHPVPGIGDRDEARVKGNVLAGKAIRGAPAIQPLVVMAARAPPPPPASPRPAHPHPP